MKGSYFWLVGGDDWLDDKFGTNSGGLTAQVGGRCIGLHTGIVEGGGGEGDIRMGGKEDAS